MKIKSRFTSKALSVILAFALILAAVPTGILSVSVFASSNKLNFGIVSDVHYYPEEYMADTKAFEEWAMSGNKQYINEEGILESALATFAKQAEDNGMKYVIIPGDLTHNGEYLAHEQLAARLEKFEKDTGVQVLVINGNHDINNGSAASFANGESAVSVKATTPEEFRAIYKNLGYDLATATFTPPKGEKAGMLSYAVELDGYRYIFIDGGKYSSDSTSDGDDEHETAGNYSEALFAWVLNQTKEAKAKGETVIGVDHWSLVPHCDLQSQILQGFVLDNWLQVGEALADAGMHYIFTGHSHSSDVSEHISDNGETMWDIQTNSLVEFPNYIRMASFTTDSTGKITLDYENLDCDDALNVTSHGVTYDKPYRQTFSFNYTYKGDLAEYCKGLVKPMISNLFVDIENDGGLVKYIGKYFDIESFISKYLGTFTPNAMAFVNDLGSQIDKKYIEDPAYTLSVLNNIIDELCDMQISDYPCMALYDEFGLGDSTKPGTFGEAALVAMINMFKGNEELSDPFMLDVIDKFENGDLGKQVFNKLYELIVDDLLQDEILSSLYVNVDTLFTGTGYDEVGGYVQLFTDLLVAVTGGDIKGNIGKILDEALSQGAGMKPIDPNKSLKGTTYLELANSVLKVLDATDVLKGGSIDGALGVIMEEYLTESQYEAWGHTFAEIIKDIGSDLDPAYKADSSGKLTYSGKVQVPVNADNYRAPSLISTSLGNDSETTMNISWYTKYSVTATDIEIIPYSDTPVFSGKNSVPAGVIIKKTAKATDRTFPGVDLGVIGLMTYTENLQRHIVKIEGLEAGKSYLYRVGDAKRGWWSDTGTIKTADGSEDVTFLHITDSQGQNEKQYSVFADVLETAFGKYQDTDLIIHSGDMVDEGNNLNYWKYFFNCSEDMRKVPLMPVAGNHEAKGEYALDTNFVLPDSVEQDTESGYYYSFDYNNVHFIMLNTNDTTDDGLSTEQLNWIKADAKASTAQWKIVVLHKALYSNGSHYDDKDVCAMRAQFASLMPELGIDMVFQGHDHVYLRTDAMDANTIVDVDTTTVNYKSTAYTAKVDPDGTVYAISGASGCKSYVVKNVSETDKLFPRAEKIVETDAPVFSGIRIVGNTLYFDAYTVDSGIATKIDSFAIQKNKLLGDVDLDGKITTVDARMILRVAVELDAFTAEQLKLADVNGDGHITTIDARLVLRKASGLSSY